MEQNHALWLIISTFLQIAPTITRQYFEIGMKPIQVIDHAFFFSNRTILLSLDLRDAHIVELANQAGVDINTEIHLLSIDCSFELSKHFSLLLSGYRRICEIEGERRKVVF